MDVRKPKPIGNWREFAGEIGVIVVGIAIALTGEQLVEALRWRHDVAEARDSLDRQAADQLFDASERVGLQACETRQLDRLAEIVSQQGMTPRIWRGVGIPVRSWNASTWQAATASGAVAHMSPGQRQKYAVHFGAIDTMGALNQQEFLLASDLRTLGAPQELSDTARDRLASDIARLRGLGALIAVASRQMVAYLEPMGIQLDAQAQKTLKSELAKPCLMPDAPPAA
jgi:hypothetical protein